MSTVPGAAQTGPLNVKALSQQLRTLETELDQFAGGTSPAAAPAPTGAGAAPPAPAPGPTTPPDLRRDLGNFLDDATKVLDRQKSSSHSKLGLPKHPGAAHAKHPEVEKGGVGEKREKADQDEKHAHRGHHAHRGDSPHAGKPDPQGKGKPVKEAPAKSTPQQEIAALQNEVKKLENELHPVKPKPQPLTPEQQLEADFAKLREDLAPPSAVAHKTPGPAPLANQPYIPVDRGADAV